MQPESHAAGFHELTIVGLELLCGRSGEAIEDPAHIVHSRVVDVVHNQRYIPLRTGAEHDPYIALSECFGVFLTEISEVTNGCGILSADLA